MRSIEADCQSVAVAEGGVELSAESKQRRTAYSGNRKGSRIFVRVFATARVVAAAIGVRACSILQ